MKNEGESLYAKIIHFFDSATENPTNALLIAIGLVCVFLVGIILDWDWTLHPTGSSDMINKWIDIFGRKTVRIIYGLVMVILLICLGYMYYYYTFK